VAALLENRLFVVLAGVVLMFGASWLTGAALEHQAKAPAASSPCRLGNGVEHVVYLQFDNLHLSRDVPSVPSDLEQMPHLLRFLEENGTLLSSNHTPLISHSGGDLVTSLTGLYPDHHGQGVGDTWRDFNADGGTASADTLTYLTSRVSEGHAASSTDTAYNLVTSGGRNVPAPWVPFTRAGCDVGSVAGPAGLVLENTGSDLNSAFGPGSREVMEARIDPARAAADYTGLAVHCASESAECSAARGGRPDRLPNEPGGYEGFSAVYGQRYLGPLIAPSQPLTDLEGRPLKGFGGFDAMPPAVGLAYVAAMQEHGVPVTFAYLADPHDPRGGGNVFGPGEPGLVQQLRDYDRAFAGFLDRLKRDRIGPANALFVVSAAHGSHFVGGAPTPSACDGRQTPCGYQQPGQVQVNLPGLLAEQQRVTTPFAMRDDAAPAIWLTGDPGPAAPQTRAVERAAARLLVKDPRGGPSQLLVRFMADRAEMGLLHMVSADPTRTPSLVLFADPAYELAGGPTTCGSSGCLAVDPRSAYNHGTLGADETTTWLGLAGPGVARRSLDAVTWVDQVDIRPTLLALTGLRDSYLHDGRVISEALQAGARPPGIRAAVAAYENVAASLKQLDAPVGRLGMLSLSAATHALSSDAAGDGAYRLFLARIQGFTERRDAVAERMLKALDAAAFAGRSLDSSTAAALVDQSNQLLIEIGRA
jgi:hypothetical protein